MRRSAMILMLCLGLAPSLWASTLLGASTITQEEVWCWRQRAGIDTPGLHGINCDPSTIGAYVASGDVSTNSPGDWNKIVSNATGTLSTGRWTGPATGSCVTNGSSVPEAVNGNPAPGDRLRDAAFDYLVTGNLTLRSNALTELLAQVAEPGAQFSSTTSSPSIPPWCVIATNNDNFFRPAQWSVRIMYAYNYLIAGDAYWGQTLSGANKTTIENWILATGTYFEAVNNVTLNNHVQNRKATSTFQEQYTWTGGGSRCTANFFIPWFGGTMLKVNMDNWNNRQTAIMMPYGIAGVLLNNATLKLEAKRYFTEWIRYSMRSDGMNTDASKLGESGFCASPAAGCPNQYMAYSPSTLGILGQVADAFARSGDTSLYDYSTSIGDCTTAGGPKTFLQTMIENGNHIDHTLIHYGTDDSGRNGNANFIIDTVSEPDSNFTVTDHSFAMMNLYYKNAYIKTIYRRTAVGQNGYSNPIPQYPASPAGSYYPWGSAWGVTPGTLFMASRLDGVIDPYNLTSGPVVNLTASTPVVAGTASTLTYSAPTATSCTPSIVSGPADPTWTGISSADLIAGTGSPKAGTARASATTYQLSCTDGTTPTTVTAAVNVISPVAHWPFNETGTSTFTAADATGLGHTGTLYDGTTASAQGPTWITGRVNNAIHCDGSNDNVQVAHAADINITGDMSIVTWLRLVSTTNLSTNAVVLTKTTNSDETPWHIELNTPGAPHFSWYHHNTAGDFSASLSFTGYTIPLNTWIYAMFVRTITSPARTVALYINGSTTPVQSLTWTSADDPQASTGPMRICTNETRVTTRYANIDLDDLRIYPVALTGAQIAALYNTFSTALPGAPTNFRVVTQ